MNKNHETIEYSEIMKKSYIDYALSVIIERALPDIRDGLKPVQRKILFDLYDLGVLPSKQHRKCGRIVGDTMGRFHPHGDSSIYEALIRMSQDFKLNIPLVDVHGNNGSLDGDSCAASRYTECRLAQLGYEMVKDLDPRIVSYIDNYDGTEKEPAILPTLIPNLMLMGANGLAVGIKTEIPTHNLGELIDAIVAYMKKKSITTSELLKYIPGPDYPTGGIITNKKEMANLYETGNGKVTIRSKIHQEPGQYGRTNLIITEIPYTFSGSKLKLLEHLIALVKDKKLDEIAEIRDESEADVRIVLEVKKGVNIEKFLSKLYSKTKLEDSQSCNFYVVNGTVPMQIGLKDYIAEYIRFQNEVYTNKYKMYLSKEEREMEILEGLSKAYDQIDAIIETIRYSKNLSVAKKCLTTGSVTDIAFKTKKAQNVAKKFDFTETQAQVILDMKLQRLNGLEITAIQKKQEECGKKIDNYKKILNSKTMLNTIIKKDLLELKKEYAIPRKTKIIDSKVEYVEEKQELIEETVVLLVDRFGYVKTIDIAAYNRAGEDTLSTFKTQLPIKNTDKLMIFTKSGTLFQIGIDKIPKLKVKEKGVPLQNLFKNYDGKDEILCMTPASEQKEFLFLFDNGYAKRVAIEEYETKMKKTVGTKVVKSELLRVFSIKDEKELKINERTFEIDKLPLQKKTGKGNKIWKWKKEMKDFSIE